MTDKSETSRALGLQQCLTSLF